MRHTLLLALGVAALILVLPLTSAGGCISDVELVVGVGTAVFVMHQVFDGEDAAEIRDLVDAGAGNGDGEIDDTEVGAWESAMSGPSGSIVSTCLDSWSDFMGGFVLQAGAVPETFEGFRATMSLEGSRSATTGDPLLLRFSGVFRFDAEGPEAELVVVPEAFEGISEMIECMAPDRIESTFAQNPCGDTGSDPLPAMRRLEIRPADGARIDEESIRPGVARAAFDGTAIVLTDFVAEETLSDIRFRLVEDEGGFPWLWIAAAAGGLAAVGALLRAGAERARFRFWSLLSVFGFTRIRREKALDHRRRESILAAIASEPGVHLGALQRGLGMATGTLVHHLRVLEQAGLVETHRRANRVQFVPAGHAGPINPSRTALQTQILATMARFPGLSQSELAERLDAPRNTVAYNVRRLVDDGHVEVEREGRVVRHYHVPGAHSEG